MSCTLIFSVQKQFIMPDNPESMRNLLVQPGLILPRGKLLPSSKYSAMIIDRLRRANTDDGPVTPEFAATRIIEVLSACHDNKFFMDGIGRSSNKFWREVRNDVLWINNLRIDALESFVVMILEAARKGPEQRVPFGRVGHAAIYVLADVREAKRFYGDMTRGPGEYGGPIAREWEIVPAERRYGVDSVPSEPIRVFPATSYRRSQWWT